MLQIETLMVMVGSEDTLLGRAVTLTPAPRGDQELDTALHTTLICTLYFYFVLRFCAVYFIVLYRVIQ